MLLRIFAVILGLFFVAIGVMGFYPEWFGGKILGLFTANKMDNLCHLITGIVAVFCGLQSAYASKILFVIIGVTTGAFALYGFIQGPGTYYGMSVGGLPDLWLLTSVSVISLYLGFFLKKGK